MSQVRQFIDQIAAGQSADAKESLENILSGKAFESLDSYKKDIASSIFGGVEEQVEENEDESELTLEDFSMEELEEYMMGEEFEQLDELSMDTIHSYYKKRQSQANKARETAAKNGTSAAKKERASANKAETKALDSLDTRNRAFRSGKDGEKYDNFNTKHASGMEKAYHKKGVEYGKKERNINAIHSAARRTIDKEKRDALKALKN